MTRSALAAAVAKEIRRPVLFDTTSAEWLVLVAGPTAELYGLISTTSSDEEAIKRVLNWVARLLRFCKKLVCSSEQLVKPGKIVRGDVPLMQGGRDGMMDSEILPSGVVRVLWICERIFPLAFGDKVEVVVGKGEADQTAWFALESLEPRGIAVATTADLFARASQRPDAAWYNNKKRNTIDLADQPAPLDTAVLELAASLTDQLVLTTHRFGAPVLDFQPAGSVAPPRAFDDYEAPQPSQKWPVAASLLQRDLDGAFSSAPLLLEGVKYDGKHFAPLVIDLGEF